MNLNDITLDIELVDPAALKEHEQIYQQRRQQLVEQIKTSGCVDYPILIDNQHNVILDGHHRAAALISLKVKWAPVIRVDYFNPEIISVKPRPNCPIEPLTKQAVLEMGLSNQVFPPKSTKHILHIPESRVDYPLDELLR